MNVSVPLGIFTDKYVLYSQEPECYSRENAISKPPSLAMCKIAHRRPCSEHLVPIGFSQCKQQSFICSVSTFMVDLPLLSEPTQRLKQPIVYGNIDEMMRLRRNVPAANRLNIIICSHLRTPKNAPKPPKEPPPRHLKEAGAVREWGRSCRNKD